MRARGGRTQPRVGMVRARLPHDSRQAAGATMLLRSTLPSRLRSSASFLRSLFAGRGWGGLHLPANLAVLALEEQQRGAFGHDHLFDFCDKNRVVASILRGVQAAFEIGERAAQYGRAVFRALELRSRLFGSAVVRAGGAGIVLGNRTLGLRQDVYAEALFGVEVGVGTGVLVNADQHEHGIEGNRGERVGGHAVDFVLGVEGDDGDAGCEAGQGSAKFRRAHTHGQVLRGEQARRPDTLPRRWARAFGGKPKRGPVGGEFWLSCMMPLSGDRRRKAGSLWKNRSRVKHTGTTEASASLANLLDEVASGRAPSRDEAIRLMRCDDEFLPHLLSIARAAKEQFKPGIITYSRKVFLPLTNLCRDYCGYCIFRRDPGQPGAHTMTPEEVLAVVRQGEQMGCTEALFSLGDKPELLFPEMRERLRKLGYRSTLQYLEAMCALVLRESRLLPHPNPGLLSSEWVRRLAAVSPSMGLMLESTNAELLQAGAAHDNAPDKVPAKRLQTIREAGKQRVPFTTGLLIGIGESVEDRVDTLLTIREMHERYGHIQEVIVQNFRAKPGIPMQNSPEPSLGEMLRTVAVARLLMPRMNIQAPPNLSAPYYDELLDAGINDWGGVSPLTPDFINPEKPWPHLEQLRVRTEAKGFRLEQRLPVYPEFVPQIVERGGVVAGRVQSATDGEGYARRAA
jgi:7,8-didemethyl-8-hydroxy-5-deazariboflavin synthase CofG subunit